MSERPVVRVSVTDIDMRFLSMVRFMVKWAIAAIPAFLILLILGAVFWGLLLGLLSGIGSSFSRKSADLSDAAKPSSQSTGSARKTGSGTAPDAAIAAYIPKIAIRNVRVARSVLGGDGVFGEVKNAGDQSLKKIELTIYCLDANGDPIFEKQYHPVLVSDFGFGDSDSNQPLKPGYSRQFGVRLDDAPSDWAKKVSVKVTSLEFQ